MCWTLNGGGIETFLSLVLAGEFLWVACLWSYLTAINYLGGAPESGYLWVTGLR